MCAGKAYEVGGCKGGLIVKHGKEGLGVRTVVWELGSHFTTIHIFARKRKSGWWSDLISSIPRKVYPQRAYSYHTSPPFGRAAGGAGRDFEVDEDCSGSSVYAGGSSSGYASMSPSRTAEEDEEASLSLWPPAL